MRRRLAPGLVALLALLLVACGGVPSDGPVRVVRRVPAEGPDVPEGPTFRRRLPPNPPADASPAEIVSGFLFAQASPEGDHAIARKHLGPNVTWNASTPLTVYESPRIGRAVVTGETATVEVSFSVLGSISQAGEFVAPARQATPLTYRLRRHPDLGWRLAAAPPGVMLTRGDVSNSYQRVTLYYPSTARRLVPHQVFLRDSDQPAASVARALLEGPRGWIRPSVRSAIPEGTELLDPPTVVDGVVTLNFSREIRRAPQETLGALTAQVVWTLTEPSLAVEAVRIQAEGEPLSTPGRAALREHRRSDWAEWDPLQRPFDERLFFVRDAAPYALDSAGEVARLAPLGSVESFAVNRAGTQLAAVTRIDRGRRRALVLVDLSDSTAPRTALVADTITMPTWEPESDVVWAATYTGGVAQVVTVPVSGPAGAVEATLPTGTVTALRLSPDGARAVLLVRRDRAGASAFVARVQRPGAAARVLAEPRPVAQSVSEVSAVSFDGPAQLVLAGVYDGGRTLVRLDVDGFNPQPLRVQGLPAAPVTSLSSSFGAPPDRVATVGNRMWRRSPGTDWAPIAGTGTGATYAG